MKQQVFHIGLFLLALCLLAASCTRKAEPEPPEGIVDRTIFEGGVYELDPESRTYALCSVEERDATRFAIADSIEDKAVVAVASGAFDGMFALTEVVIPKSVKEICDSAFAGAEHLQSVFYRSGEILWEDLIIGGDNLPLCNANVYYYSGEAPDVANLYWHEVEGVPTVWGENQDQYGELLPLQ